MPAQVLRELAVLKPEPIRPGLIIRGWAWVTYKGAPVALIGPGDFLHPSFFGSALRIVPIGDALQQSTEVRVDLAHNSLTEALARHAARLATSALARTADLFVELVDKIDPEGSEPMAIQLPLSQGQLGTFLGISTVHMNRTLAVLKKGGLLSYDKGEFTVFDRTGLAAQAKLSEEG